MPSSPWVTGTGANASTPTTTPIAPQAGVDQINSVDYMVNADKIQLIQDWMNEQQTKSQLDTQATTLGVSATAYDNAVAALSAGLIAAGAPSGWTTSWPDGTTSGPWTSVMINLKTWWTSIALNRATLQAALTSKVQANAAYADALARSPNNLIKNGNGQQASPAGYEATGLVAGAWSSGQKCRAITGAGAGNYGAGLQFTDKIPCVLGDQFRFEADLALYTGNDGQILISIVHFDKDGNNINNNTNIYFGTVGTVTRVVVEAPAQGYFVAFAANTYGTSIGKTGYLNNLYACRKVTAGMLQGDAIQTTNYTQDGSGNPTAGARMDISATALKVAAGNFQLGPYVFTDYFYRQLQAIDGSNGGRVVYRGNIDTTTRGGAPNIACLTVQRRRWDTTMKYCRLLLTMQPTAPSDNLDAMRYAAITLYRQSALGTTATLTLIDSFFQPITDRLYGNFTTDSNSTNAMMACWEASDTAISSGAPAALVCLYNAYGPSGTNCFYSSSGGGDGVALVNNGTTWPSGLAGGSDGGTGGGGGSAGGGCPAPWVEITLASGLTVHAADLYDGAQVVGVNDMTMEPAAGIVRHPMIRWVDRVPVILEDGRAPEFSLPHRVAVMGRGWVEVRHLQPGDELVAQRPSIVKGLGKPIKAQVVTFQVEGCATYFSDGILSHNLKLLVL